MAILPDANSARFWFAGDLINRGPNSLGTLRLVRSLGDRAVCVLGNHDLHLLAAASGVRKPSARDTLQEILEAPDCDELLHWLRHQPMAHLEGDILLVHAGVHPSWTARETLIYAHEVEQALRGPKWRNFLADMYGDQPQQWQPGLTGNARLRAIVNILTRMRMLRADASLDMNFKDSPARAPTDLTAWFDMENRRDPALTVIFGHWSTLGLSIKPGLISLDSGCVWGGNLSAVRLSDFASFQVPCPAAQDPAPD